MQTSSLVRISFGAARTLTRDGLDGPYLEMPFIPSRTPVN